METSKQTIIEQAYDAFNNREIDRVLDLMASDVRWPRAFEGDFVTGKDNVREYWRKQWTEINPRVDPIGFETREDGKCSVDVHQVVRDMNGNLLADQNVRHIYTFDNGYIKEMTIEIE